MSLSQRIDDAFSHLGGSGMPGAAVAVIRRGEVVHRRGYGLADIDTGGPLGEEIANAIAEGYSDKRKPYHGYYFKILKGQGPSAPLGEMDFVVQGAMIGGSALVAAPADYEKTGIKTFIVGYDGVVHEKDLGPETLAAFEAMERFDPDESWSPVEEP